MKTITKVCKRGTFSFYEEDGFIGEALNRYGEYSDFECAVFERVLRPGDVAIDVGANIGVFTIPMAKLVGATGKVIAFEPGADNVHLLRLNGALNQLDNIVALQAAASDEDGSIAVTYEEPNVHYPKVARGGENTVTRMTIDGMKLDKCKFIKIDVDGHEMEVLSGAAQTISRCRPVIYIENEHEDKAGALISKIVDYDYRLFWFRPTQFNYDNFNGNRENIFGNLVSLMMICVPEEQGITVAGCEEVCDIRMDDQMFDREIRRYTRIVQRNPKDLNSRLLIAHYNNLMQRSDVADEIMAGILAEDPQHHQTLSIKGLLDLQRGNWQDGWAGYELRYSQAKRIGAGRHKHGDAVQWDGAATKRNLLVTHEQGFGDMLMFARFMKEVLRRAPNAYLEIHPFLYELFEVSDIVPPDRLIRMGRTLPPYAAHCSMASLPYLLGMNTNRSLEMKAAYIWPEREMSNTWCKRPGPRIGFCGHGSHRSERPYTRDFPELMARGLNRRFGPFLDLTHESGQFGDFSDTAAAISSLDLVITVDTSIAHLAGAMGVPVWLLLSWDPDWRWGLKDTKSVWYPSMTIFRQHAFNKWDGVVNDVANALEARKASKQRVA